MTPSKYIDLAEGLLYEGGCLQRIIENIFPAYYLEDYIAIPSNRWDWDKVKSGIDQEKIPFYREIVKSFSFDQFVMDVIESFDSFYEDIQERKDKGLGASEMQKELWKSLDAFLTVSGQFDLVDRIVHRSYVLDRGPAGYRELLESVERWNNLLSSVFPKDFPEEGATADPEEEREDLRNRILESNWYKRLKDKGVFEDGLRLSVGMSVFCNHLLNKEENKDSPIPFREGIDGSLIAEWKKVERAGFINMKGKPVRAEILAKECQKCNIR